MFIFTIMLQGFGITDRQSIVVGNDEHIVVDIYGADWISIKSGSNSVVTMAFSTF
jgi:hypothetical protein